MMGLALGATALAVLAAFCRPGFLRSPPRSPPIVYSCGRIAGLEWSVESVKCTDSRLEVGFRVAWVDPKSPPTHYFYNGIGSIHCRWLDEHGCYLDERWVDGEMLPLSEEFVDGKIAFEETGSVFFVPAGARQIEFRPEQLGLILGPIPIPASRPPRPPRRWWLPWIW
jgi:hypothetical protein